MLKNKYIFLGLLLLLFCSCHFYTAISYRIDKKQEYVKQDGYILSCKKDGDMLVVGTYTPDSWGEGFYFNYLEGIKSDKKIKITNVKLRFVETMDTLTLKEIRNEREYIFVGQNLLDIIDKNKHLKLTVYYLENNSATIVEKEFTLVRYKSTYPTGTFPHS